MNRQSSLRFAAAFIFAAFAVAALALADFGALAQNSNTSTTAEDSTQNANANTAPTRRGRGRRGRRTAAANANAADANANTGDATMTPDNSTPAAAAQVENMTEDLSGERADLSGTYTGHVTMSGGHDMDGQATLTITGNTFQMSGEGMNHGGRVYAVLTRGEISAAFYFTDLTDPTTNTPVVANVRVRKRGDRMTLRPAPNARTPMTFTTGGGVGTPRPRRPRRGRTAPVTPDANTNTNTTPPR
ncbi:MAG TPA: hypothetical protein VJ866_23510 [Pyrinomonadaceae bacterium]|nr:hypothetical protein [Pyrinomonadaceae bacterium]